MKKTLSFVLALSTVCSMCLSGCGENSSSQSSAASAPQSGASQSESSSETELEPVTLQYWILGEGKQKDSDLVWEEVNRLIQEKLPNTTVEFTSINGAEYGDKWIKAMAAQEQIDIAWSGYATNLADDVNKGALTPIDGLVAEYGQDIVAALSQQALDIHKSADGNLYFIPAWQGMVGGRSALYLPSELTALAGETWVEDTQALCYENYSTYTADAKKPVYDKLEEFLKAAKDAGKLALGFNPTNFNRWYGTGIWAESYGYIVEGDETFTVKSWQASDVNKQNYAIMADWYQKGYIRSDIASAEIRETNFKADGLNGYLIRSHNGFTDDAAETASKDAGIELDAIFTSPACTYVLGTSTGTVIPKTSKNPERAMMVINLLYADEGAKAYQTFVYGLEETHWKNNGDGTVTTLCGDGSPTSDWAYGAYKWTLGTCMNALTTQTDVPGYYEGLKAMEDTAYASPLLAFKFDSTNVATEKAQMDAVKAEYENALIYGYLGADWEATYNEFVSKLNQAGLETYLTELQRQISDFVAANGSKW